MRMSLYSQTRTPIDYREYKGSECFSSPATNHTCFMFLEIILRILHQGFTDFPPTENQPTEI